MTFGPKFTLPLGNFAVYTHFLVGVADAHGYFKSVCLPSTTGSCSESTPSFANVRGTGMSFKTGAGVDWNHGRWGVRILEVDYVHASLNVTARCPSCQAPESFGVGGNGFELATGITFNFGGR